MNQSLKVKMDGQSSLSSTARERIGNFMTFVRQRSNSELNYNNSMESEADTTGLSARGAAVLNVLNIVFGACTGASTEATSTNVVEEDEKATLKKTVQNKKATKAKNNTLKISTSRDECHYAQYYDNDHGRAARATLVMRQNEDRKLNARRERSLQMYKEAGQEAEKYSPVTSQETRKSQIGFSPTGQRSSNNNKPSQFGYANTMYKSERVSAYHNHTNLGSPNNHPIVQHQRRYQNNEPTMIHHVLTPDKGCPFDDDISAISAHTLEEMMKSETVSELARQSEKFEGLLPPSPAKTESSESADDQNGTPKDDIRDEPSVSNKPKFATSHPSYLDRLPENSQGAHKNTFRKEKKNKPLAVNTSLEIQIEQEFKCPPKPTAANSAGKSFSMERHPHDENPIQQGRRRNRNLLRLTRRELQYYEVEGSHSAHEI